MHTLYVRANSTPDMTAGQRRQHCPKRTSQEGGQTDLPPYMTQDNTPPGPIFQSSISPRTERMHTINETIRFRRAIDQEAATPPFSAPPLFLLLINRALKVGPGGVLSCVVCGTSEPPPPRQEPLRPFQRYMQENDKQGVPTHFTTLSHHHEMKPLKYT